MKANKIFAIVFTALIIIATIFCVGCTKQVQNYELTVKFQGKDITGKYTGPLIDDVATTDSAIFTYTDGDNYLNYTGGFKDGQFSGTGTLETNFYVVNFDDVDRTGEYKGDVTDGTAKGHGTFTATNDEGETYTYNGAWDNGLYNGYGKTEYSSGAILDGNFVNGNFTPNKLELLNYLGTNNSNMQFILTDNAKNFIKEHENILPTNNFEDIKNIVDNTIEFKHLQKNISNYGNTLIKPNVSYVTQINEVDYYDNKLTIIQMGTIDNFYYIYYFGTLDDIYNSDQITVYGLPIATTSFTNVSNTTTQAVVLVASYVSKQ